MNRHELNAAGIDLTPGEYARLARFVTCLAEENRQLNLTAAREEKTLWRAHVCDSLALLPLVREHRVKRLLDLGSGGGLPGLPLACVCEQVHVTLLDSTRKKMAALERIIAGVGLGNARAVWGRAETRAHEATHREQYDAVTARAVAALSALIEYAAGFVRPGGRCWFFKSASAVDEERAAAESAARGCAMRWVGEHHYRLPAEECDRVLVIYRKETALPATLPRPPGRARKRPL